MNERDHLRICTLFLEWKYGYQQLENVQHRWAPAYQAQSYTQFTMKIDTPWEDTDLQSVSDPSESFHKVELKSLRLQLHGHM